MRRRPLRACLPRSCCASWRTASTAANLLLTGDINAAIVTGADAQRLEQEDLFSVDTGVLFGEMWFNHAEGRSTADPAVRLALTQAVDLGELAQVLTAGAGLACHDLRDPVPGRVPRRLDRRSPARL